ncbi:hypothetical protein ACQJBY_004433 [Aegilops geniculata]
MGLPMARGPCCCSPSPSSSSSSSSSSPWMLQAHLPKHPHPPLGGRSVCSESLRVLAMHLLLNRHANLSRRRGEIIRTAVSSPGLLQITENRASSSPIIKVDAERTSLDGALDRNAQFNMSVWMDVSHASSNSLEYNLLMQNIHVLQSSLAAQDLVMLETDILVHIEQLGALKWFNASRSSATITHTSHETDFAFLWNDTEFAPVTPLDEQSDDDQLVVIRSGKSQERKLKRIRASEKVSVVCVKASSRKPRKSRRSTSSQFISEWKNYPGRRRSIVREQSELLVTIKECANLEKIRENMVKEGQEVCYDKWAKAAGVDEAVLKSRLQAGYCCRERLLVTTEWLVKYIARTYAGMGTAFEDLLQAGKMGVLDGAERFDRQRGCKFSTYVKYWIRKPMLALLAENSGVIQLPARMDCIIRKVREAKRAIRSSTGRNPIDAEIATFVGASVANVRLARKCSRRVVSLYMEVGAGLNAKFVGV